MAFMACSESTVSDVEFQRLRGLKDQPMLNLTPHDIVIMDEEKNVRFVFPSSGCVARVSSQAVDLRPVAVWKDGEGPNDVVTEDMDGVVGVPVVRVEYGDIEDFVTPVDVGKAVLVSMFVAQVIQEKRSCSRFDFHNIGDVFYPDTGPDSVFRNEKGHIIGVRRLIQV